MDKLLQVTIPVVVKGEPKGVKQQGGVLEFVRREIEIECLPADIPEHVEVDVSELMLHQGIRVRDIATNAKWKPISDPDMMLVHVIMPKAEEVAAPADAAAAAHGDAGRARSHQEGQEGRGRTTKDDKKKDDEEVADLRFVKADRRARQSRARSIAGTRHNVGFAVVDELARRWRRRVRSRRRSTRSIARWRRPDGTRRCWPSR